MTDVCPHCGGYSPAGCQCSSCDPGFSDRLAAMVQSMEDCCITYAFVATDFEQGVTSGGNDRTFRSGQKIDQFLIFDSGKAGLWQGMTMTMHAESRLGNDVNNAAVGLAPANVAMLYPKPGAEETAITGLSFAQALNEEVVVTFGKFNALDLFYQLYPQTGRGINGFMNASMVIPLSMARIAPLSFLGAGAMKLRGKQVQGSLLVYDTHNIPTTSGFDELFDNGANIMAYWRCFTEIGGLPGSHGFGGVWSTGEFTAFDPSGFVFVPGQGIVAPREGGANTLFYILEQTLWTDYCDPNRSIGILSQWGLADETTSPFHWTCNVAVQAQGFCRNRPGDAFGVGYFYTGLSEDFTNLISPLITLDDVQGVELYYNMALAKCCHVTADVQVIQPAEVANETAVVCGVRASVGL
jgi:porin